MELKKDIQAMFDLEIQAKRLHGVDFTWQLSKLQDLSVSGAKGQSNPSPLFTP
jgi:hypothetical protein